MNSSRLSVETLIDRKVYSVSGDVQSTFGSVSDILTAIPSVDVDPDGVVSLRGDSNVLILIDGKPSTQLSGSAAGDNLQSISAKNIERIEVITTPPAQFKADGAAGIINIVTRKEHPQGLAGSVQASMGTGGRAVAGANASYGAGPLTLSAAMGYRYDYRVRRIASEVRGIDPTSLQLLDSNSILNERIHRQVPSGELKSEYAWDEKRTLSGSFNWSERGGLRTYAQDNSSSTATGAPAASNQRLSYGHDPEYDYDERLGFSQKLGRTGAKLDLSLHRSTSHQREDYAYTNVSILPPAAPSFSGLALLEDRATTDVAADCALPISETRRVQLGYALQDDDFRYGNIGTNRDPVTGMVTIDPNITHDFQFRQWINAAYASFQEGVGPWNLLGGVRAEQTRTDAQQLTSALSNAGSYLRLYPSLHLERTLSNEATISLGASRRVSRPDPSNLDPYVDHEYAPNLRAGNANLRPQYTQAYEMGYGLEQRGRSYQFTGYLRRNRDSVTDVTQYLGNGLSLTTKTNLPRNDAAGVELSANGHLGSALTYGVSANFFHSQIDASALGVAGLQSTNGVNAKAKLDFHPTEDDSVQLIFSRTDKRLTPQGYVRAINIVNAGYKFKMRAGLTATLTISDLFNGQRYERRESTPTFTGDYQRTVRGRVLYLGFTYAFGSTKKGKDEKLEYDTSE